MASLLDFALTLLLLLSTLAQIQEEQSNLNKIPSQSQNVESNAEVKEAFQKSGIVPDVLYKPPPNILMAAYETANVSLGNEIFATRAVIAPCILYEAESKTLYTFMMLDIDAPSRGTPVLRSYIIMLYVNIPGSYLKKGFSVVPYIPVTPKPGSGPHRYVLLVYKQYHEINCKDEELVSLGVFRWRFSIRDFEKKYGLTDLIAGNFFISEIPKNFADFC